MPDLPESHLEDLVRRLGSPYGLERSIKFVTGNIYADRILLSIHADTLGESPVTRLKSILDETGFPASSIDQVLDLLPAAELIHFGFERNASGYLYKCYLENSVEYLTAVRRGVRSSALVYTAFKWEPGKTNGLRVSEYTGHAGAELFTITNQIKEIYTENQTSSALAAILSIIEHVTEKNPQIMPMFMTVTEAENPRFSFDLNLYDASLHLNDFHDEVFLVSEYFGVDQGAWTGHYSRIEHMVLGHLSGGIDAMGEEFFTIYFGVMEQNGPAR